MKKILIFLPILMVLCALSTGAHAETLPFDQRITLGFEGVRLQGEPEGTNLGTRGITLPGGDSPYQGIASFGNAVLGEYGGTTAYGWATGTTVDTITTVIGGPQVVIDNVAKYFTDSNDFDGDLIYSPAKFITDPLPPPPGGAGSLSFKMTVNFAQAVTDVAFYALDVDGDDIDGVGTLYTRQQIVERVYAKVYGEGGFTKEILLDGDVLDLDSAAYYMAFGSTPGITKLEVWYMRPGANGIFGDSDDEMKGGGGIDYLSFTPVPEPATMFLLGSGLIGIGVFVRRKFKK